MNETDGNMEQLLMASFFKAENICFPNFKNISFSIGMSFCVMNTYENKSDVCIDILYMCVFVCFPPTERKSSIQNNLE